MSDSRDLFDFLNDVWDILPEEDQLRFGELWKSYEQTYGDVWMKMIETSLGASIDYVPLYNNLRWRKHFFDSTTEVLISASYTGNQDLSLGINLTDRYLLRFGVDGGTPIEVDLRGSSPSATTITEIILRINTAAGFAFASSVGGALLVLKSRTKGPTSQINLYQATDPLKNAMALILGVDDALLPATYPKLPYTYQLADKAMVHIPSFQDKIHDELVTLTLNENTDYLIEFGSGIISFDVVPPATMWAKDNLVNYETPYNNFGYLLDIYDKNTPSFLKAVRGLWFAFWTGPRPENIRRSLYLLFGLPAASKPGTVTEVTLTTISLAYTDGTTETFTIPSELVALVAVGDTVTRFQPLVSGITLQDKINAPGFVEREVGRYGIQYFLTQNASRGPGPNTDETKALKLLEQNVYLPQIDVNAFISPDIKLSNVKSFLQNIQPKSRTFLFQILAGHFKDLVEFFERIGLDIRLSVDPNLDYNPSLEITQADREDTETNDGTSNILDSECFTLTESLSIDVYNGVIPVLVDTFNVEG